MSEPLADADPGAKELDSFRPIASTRRVWVAAILGGIIAAALTGGAGEVSFGWFKGKEIANPLAETVDMADTNRVDVKNAVLAWGAQGALLGLTLAIAGSLAGRSPRGLIGAVPAGLILGGGLAGSAAYGVFTTFFALVDGNSADMIPALLAHASVASLIGLTAGIAFGIGLGGRGAVARSAIGGLVGAVLGSCLYEVVGALLFPVDKTGDPVAASSLARWLCHASIDLFVAVGIATVASSRSRAASTRPLVAAE